MKKFLVYLGACLLVMTSCVKDSDDDSDGEYYYKATIGGTTYHEIATENGTITNGGAINSVGTEAEYVSSIGPDTWPLPSNTTAFGFGKGILYDYYNATDNEFLNFFPVGNIPYAIGSEWDHYQNNEGVWLTWVDGNSVSWYSGTGSQAGSSFEIISREEKRDALNALFVKVKARFTCKLYKEGTNEMIQLTNGEFVGLFRKD